MRTDLERLADVKEAIDRIEKYAMRGRHAFDHDELIQTWIVHYIQIIGEACGLVSEGFKASHPEIPWKKIIGMRNVLVGAALAAARFRCNRLFVRDRHPVPSRHLTRRPRPAPTM